eukprot:SAG11_NODE_1696_length_4435_cov_3.645295_1_plen_75_part_10
MVAIDFRDYGVESLPMLGLNCFSVTQPLRKAGENLKVRAFSSIFYVSYSHYPLLREAKILVYVHIWGGGGGGGGP